MQIPERKNRRDVVPEHLGSVRAEAELAKLMSAGRDKVHAGQEALNLELSKGPQAEVVEAKHSRLLLETIRSAWTTLSFDAVDDEAFFQLVGARLIEPTSISDSRRGLVKVGMEPVHRNTFHAALRRCAEREYRDQIATKCFKHAWSGGDTSLGLYDVTTLMSRTFGLNRNRESATDRSAKERCDANRRSSIVLLRSQRSRPAVSAPALR